MTTFEYTDRGRKYVLITNNKNTQHYGYAVDIYQYPIETTIPDGYRIICNSNIRDAEYMPSYKIEDKNLVKNGMNKKRYVYVLIATNVDGMEYDNKTIGTFTSVDDKRIMNRMLAYRKLISNRTHCLFDDHVERVEITELKDNDKQEKYFDIRIHHEQNEYDKKYNEYFISETYTIFTIQKVRLI